MSDPGPSVPPTVGLDPVDRVLRSALWGLLVAAAAGFAYAVQAESSVFRAFALQASLGATAIWATLDAVKRRRRRVGLAEQGADVAREERSLQLLFFAAPVVAIAVFTALALLTQLVEIARPRSQEEIVGGAIALVLAASLWTALRLSLRGADAGRHPEVGAVRATLSESRLAALLCAAALFVSTVYKPAESLVATSILVWTLAVAAEHILRAVLGWFRTPTKDETLRAPVDSLLRDVFLSTANPVGALFDIAEARFGLSLRSSWTIQFFRRSVAPITLGCASVVWLSTSLVVVEPHQAGLRLRFGVAERQRLGPGLHAKLPWPFGELRRYPASLVRTMQIGFEDEAGEADVAADRPRSLLWTKPHAEEFALVLGSETELVAVNAIVYFKIASDRDGFLDYALAHAAPERALEAFAYRVLMEQTRGATLDEVLSRGREGFAREIERRLADYAAAERLGLDVVDVSLINLHPPVQVAADYLDVVNAGIDRVRTVTTAAGDAAARLEGAATDSGQRVATAKVDAAKRVAEASGESLEFVAAGEAYGAAPQTYRLRLWFEAFEQALTGRRLYLIDAALPQVIFDERARVTTSGDRAVSAALPSDDSSKTDDSL